jgi:hypothetical protein
VYVVLVEETGRDARVCGPFRTAGRAEAACASIDEVLARSDGEATTVVVPCLPVDAWTRLLP